MLEDLSNGVDRSAEAPDLNTEFQRSSRLIMPDAYERLIAEDPYAFDEVKLPPDIIAQIRQNPPKNIKEAAEMLIQISSAEERDFLLLPPEQLPNSPGGPVNPEEIAELLRISISHMGGWGPETPLEWKAYRICNPVPGEVNQELCADFFEKHFDVAFDAYRDDGDFRGIFKILFDVAREELQRREIIPEQI